MKKKRNLSQYAFGGEVEDPPKKGKIPLLDLLGPKPTTKQDKTKNVNNLVPKDDSAEEIGFMKQKLNLNRKVKDADAYYNPKVIKGISSGDATLDFIYNNQYLMDVPLVGDYIKNKAYNVAANSHAAAVLSDKDTKARSKSGSYSGAGYDVEETDKAIPNLLDVYFGKQQLPTSKYKPTSDYLDFLPSYSVKDYFEKNDKAKDFPSVVAKMAGKTTDFTKPIYKRQEENTDLTNLLGVDLGGHKEGIAFDKKVGLPYVSVSDAWDFEPTNYTKKWSHADPDNKDDKKAKDKAYIQSSLMHKAGTPFKVYDRMYFDPKTKEYIPDSEIDKKMKKTIKPKKYDIGTGVTGIGSQVNSMGLDFLIGNAASVVSDIFNNVKTPDPMTSMFHTQQFANGGTVPSGIPVEVEGDEVAETPFGGIINFDGPSHEAGGIDTNLPPGTTVFSDRVSLDGKTMAERKNARVRKEKNLSKFLDTNPSDIISKNTLDRTKKFLDMEDENDLGIQQLVALTEATDEDKLALGTGLLGLGGFGDPLRKLLGGADNLNTIAPEADPENILGGLPGLNFNPASPILKMAGIATPPIVAPSTDTDASMATPGDKIGQLGNAFGSIAPLLTTLSNRAGDTPNINAFENFGEDALTANSQAMDQASAIKSLAEEKVQLQAQGQRNRNRNSANSVNTLRALDFVTSAGVDAADSDIYSSFAKDVEGIYGQRAQLENQQDGMVMQGEQQRDQADRLDRDAFFNNLGENLTGVAKGVVQVGKDMNASLSNQDMLDIISDMSANGITYVRDKSGKLKQKKVK